MANKLAQILINDKETRIEFFKTCILSLDSFSPAGHPSPHFKENTTTEEDFVPSPNPNEYYVLETKGNTTSKIFHLGNIFEKDHCTERWSIATERLQIDLMPSDVKFNAFCSRCDELFSHEAKPKRQKKCLSPLQYHGLDISGYQGMFLLLSAATQNFPECGTSNAASNGDK